MPHDDRPPSDDAHRNGKAPRIAIIGAGMAGISCAQALRQRGHAATLFEQSRGIGGRLATRRTEAGDSFDHGAQYITTRSSAFERFMHAREHDGSAAPWQPQLGDGARHHHAWFVGTPGMSALLKPLTEHLAIHRGVTVDGLQRLGSLWRLHTADGHWSEPYDIVISTAPPAQSGALLAAEPAMRQALDAVAVAPCWTLMIGFDAALDIGIDARRFDTGAVAWLARQASRPGRPGNRRAWVVHASAAWSTQHLELTPAQAGALLTQELARAIGRALPSVRFSAAHRWRYAMTTQPLGQPFLASTDRSVFAGGDWCLGARVECAYESGVAIAQAVAENSRRYS